MVASNRLLLQMTADIIQDLQYLSGSEFEQLCQVFFSRLYGLHLHIVGFGLDGKPTKGKVDALSNGYAIAYGTDEDYYSVGKDDVNCLHSSTTPRKPIQDLKSVLEFGTWRQVDIVSNRECPTTRKPHWDTAFRTIAGTQPIEWWDGRRIAEMIVRERQADTFIRQLSYWLPHVQRATSLSSYSHRFPTAESFLGRAEQIQGLITQLKDRKRLHIFGISGIGKTALASEIGNRLSADFDTLVWIDASAIRHSGELEAVIIDRLGTKIDLRALCAEYSVLVVLDDVRDAALLDTANVTLSSASIISTSQTRLTADSVVVEGLSQEDAAQLLQRGSDTLAKATLERTLHATSRQPLALKLINRAIVEGDITAAQLDHELESLALFEDSAGQGLAIRILGRHTGLDREIGFLGWVDVPYIDKTWFVRCFSNAQLSKLERRALIHPSQIDTAARVHDLVRACARSAQSTKPDEVVTYELALEAVLRESLKNDDETAFNRLKDLHSKTVVKLAASRPDCWPAVYAALLGEGGEATIATQVVGALDSGKISPDIDDFSIAMDAAIEALEICKRVHSLTETEVVERYDRLSTLVPGESELALQILHHRAKAALQSDPGSALRSFRLIAASGAGSANAAKLQLARQLRDTPDEASEFLAEIFEAASTERVNLSTVLGAIETLTHRHLSDHWEKLFDRFERVIVTTIARTTLAGNPHAFRTLGLVSNKFASSRPEMFRRIVELVRDAPFPLRSTAPDAQRAALAELKRNIAELNGSSLDEALEWYAAIVAPTNYQLWRYAECAVAAKQFSLAGELLDRIPEPNRDEFWLRTHSHVLMSRGDRESAIRTAEAALMKCRLPGAKGASYETDFINTLALLEQRHLSSADPSPPE